MSSQASENIRDVIHESTEDAKSDPADIDADACRRTQNRPFGPTEYNALKLTHSLARVIP